MNEVRVTILPFQLVNNHGDTIRGEIRTVPGMGEQPLLVICHSFLAFKDWGFFPFVAEWLAGRGFSVLTFNFSLNGVEEKKNRITNFEQFASNTFTRELEDLEFVIDAACAGKMGKGMFDPSRIGLAGHSRGGGIAIVHSSTDARVKVLVTWSAIATFDRWTVHQKTMWREKKSLPLAKDSSVSPLRLGIGLLRDVEENSDTLNITVAAARIHIPWLILHGREDGTVKHREAETLYEASDTSSSKLVILDHVGHLYNAVTEEEDGYATLKRVLTLTADWFHHHFNEE